MGRFVARAMAVSCEPFLSYTRDCIIFVLSYPFARVLCLPSGNPKDAVQPETGRITPPEEVQSAACPSTQFRSVPPRSVALRSAPFRTFPLRFAPFRSTDMAARTFVRYV